MLFSTLPHRRKRHSQTSPRRPSRPRLLLEWLEPRNLLSVLNVNTDTQGVAHNETSIAVNPTNSANLIGSSNEYPSQAQNIVNDFGFLHAHVTFDGGQTWTENPIPFDPNLYTSTADPAVAFDADGTAYLAALAWKLLPNGDGTNPDLLVTHSGNGGKSWSSMARVAAGVGTFSSPGIFNDKDYIAAWGHGNAIVTWARVDQGPGGSAIDSPIFASVTHDGGKTWTAPAQISGSFVQDEGPVPVVAADGSVHVVFVSFDEEVAPQYRDHLKAVKVDPAAGLPLGTPVAVGLLFDGVHDDPINVDGRQTYQDSEFRSAPLLPGDITADPTNALHLAVVWSDTRNNPSGLGLLPDPYNVKTNSDIIISQSFDGGQTWSAPTAIQQPNDQFQPWGAYDAYGRLQIGYYDRSYDPANHMYGYTLASETTPGSLGFTEQQVTTALFDPTQGDAWFTVTADKRFPNATRFMGDYSNIAITPNGVAAFWTDMRLQSTVPGFPGSSEDAFFALVPTPPMGGAMLSRPSRVSGLIAGQGGAAKACHASPEGGTKNPTAAPTSELGNLALMRLLDPSLPSAAFTSTLPNLLNGTQANAEGIWSLDPATADRHLADFSRPPLSVALARATMRSSGLPDDSWRDAFGIPDFAVEELQ